MSSFSKQVRRFSLAALSLALLLPVTSFASNFDWIEGATIVGLCGYDSREDAAQQVQAAAASGASVIDIHAGLTGDYETFIAPDSALGLISFIADKVHEQDRHVVCYIAGLEIISHDVASGHTALKDHPNWVQRNIKGEPALFDSKAAFWIPEGTEDIWLSPFAEDWLQPYLRVVSRLARSGVDGIYMDIPYWMTHFEGWGDTWASFDDATVAEFEKRTGLDAKQAKLGDFSDPIFQAWVRFRMDAIDEFVTKVRDTIKEANPECAFAVELYPGIDMAPVVVGADPYRITNLCDVIGHEYNPYEVSSARGTQRWQVYQAGAVALRAFEWPKPGWMLTYAAKDDWQGNKIQASANLAFSHISLGSAFWECGGVRMCGSTVDRDWRAKALNWIQDHRASFYPSGQPYSGGYAVYFSPDSRTWGGPEVVESFIGASMMLLNKGIPYAVVTPRTLKQVHPKVLILPNIKLLTTVERAAIRDLATEGTTIVASGELGVLTPDLKRVDAFDPKVGTFRRIKGTPERDYYNGLALTEAWEDPREPLPDDSLNALAAQWWKAVPVLPLPEAGVLADPRGDVQVYAYPRGDGWDIQLFNTTGLEPDGNMTATPIRDYRLDIAGTGYTKATVLNAFGGEVDVPVKEEESHTVIIVPELKGGATVSVR